MGNLGNSHPFIIGSALVNNPNFSAQSNADTLDTYVEVAKDLSLNI